MAEAFVLINCEIGSEESVIEKLNFSSELKALSKPQNPKIDPLAIAISSRALFDMSESHRVYEEEGLDAYQKYQIAHEEEPLEAGVAFPLVQKLLNYMELALLINHG